MDVSTLLFWLVCLSILPALLRCVIYYRSTSRGWIVIYLLVLAVTGAGGWRKSEPGIYAGTALWVSLILVPGFLSHFYLRCLLKQRLGPAYRVAQVIRALHPADGWREQTQISRALELAQRDELPAAIELLQRHRNAKGPAGLSAVANLYRLTNRWEEFLAWRAEA